MTTTKLETLRTILDRANLNTLSDALRKVRLGKLLCPLKVTVASLTATTAVDITVAAVKAAATIVPSDFLLTGEQLPPINLVRTLRVTASGTATSVGTYIVSDASGTAIVPPGGASAAVGIALLSDDGKTITFPNSVTGFVLEYMPRSYESLESTFEDYI